MKNFVIIPYFQNHNQIFLKNFQEAVHESKLLFSVHDFAFIENISQEIINEALQQSLQICLLVGTESKHHFKQIYVFDTNSRILIVDWKMSKIGFNLMIMQMSFLNQKKANWLWKLAEF